MSVTDLAPELSDLAVALGLLDPEGEVQVGWFGNPISQTKGMLDDPDRRAALGRVIDAVLPGDPGPTTHDGAETWHLLTGEEQPQQVFLTQRTTADGLALGLAVRLATAAVPGTGTARVSGSLALELVEAFDGGLRSLVGTAGSPIRAHLDVTLDPSGSIGFEAVTLDAAVAPADAEHPVDVRVSVRGVRVDGRVRPPVVLDPNRLGPEAVTLLQTLLQDRLTALAAEPGAAAPVVALAQHLLPVLGLGGDVPRLEYERLGSGAAVFGSWFLSVLQTSAPVWLGHLSGLLGVDAAPSGSGTESDPWRVRLADLGGDRVELTIARRTTGAGEDLLVGVGVRLHGSAGLAVDADAVLIALPLAGAGVLRGVPAADLLLRAPADAAAALVDTSQLHVGFVQAGLRWDGSAVRPILELGQVEFDGHPYERLDLSSVDSARAAAAEAIRATLAAALGADGPGAHLAVLAGLIGPVGETDAPVVDPAALLASPTRELARVHRARLLSTTHSWSGMFAQLAGLLGSAEPVVGDGSAADPWRVPLATVGPLTVQLAAWAAELGSDVPSLHLGARLLIATEIEGVTISGTIQSEVVGLTLPAAAPAAVQLLSRHDARLTVTGPVTLGSVAGIGLSLGGGDAALTWSPGSVPDLTVELTGLTVHVDDAAATLPSLRLPPDASFAPEQPDLGLGIAVDELDQITRALLGRLWTFVAGDHGLLLAGLLGLIRGSAVGLPDDWPAVRLPAGGFAGLLAEPLEVLRSWLGEIALDLSSDGSPFVLTLLARLRELVSPAGSAAEVDANLEVDGAGQLAAPWRLPLAGLGSSELLVWLEPEGPPAEWTAAAAEQARSGLAARDLLPLIARFGAAHPALAGPFGGSRGPARPDELRDAFDAMVRNREDGDGVVPVRAQLPDDPAWTSGALLVDAAHHRLPEHADAVAQVLAQVEEWAPGADRTVLLVGPPFTGRASWLPLLAAAEAAQPGSTSAAAHFDLRSAPAPELADLQAVAVTASWYTADLVDAGGPLEPVVDQIGAVVGRLRELRSDASVVLVAHSTAGLAARAYAAAQPTLVAGLITLGTPHGAASLTVLDDRDEADALRLAGRLLGATQVTSPTRDAADHLLAAAEGWQATGGLPQAVRYPRDRFVGEDDHSTGGVPALAIAGRLSEDLISALGNAFADALSSSGSEPAAPTHLCVGVRVGRTPPAEAAEGVEVGCRLDLARLALVPGAPVVAQPTRLGVEIRIDDRAGFLLDPADGNGVRVRRAVLGATGEAGPGAGPIRVTADFYDAGLDGPTVPLVRLGDPGGGRLLGALMALLPAARPLGSAVVDALVALGVVARDASGALVVLADAVEGLLADAGAYFAGRAQAALAGAPGQLGLTGPSTGPWTGIEPAPPLSLELGTDQLAVRLTGVEIAGAQLGGEFLVTRDDPRPRGFLLVSGPGSALRLDSAGPTLTLTVGDETAPVTLLPRTDGLAERLASLLIEQLVAAVLGTALAARLGPGWQFDSIAELLRHPERILLTPAGPGQPPRIDGDQLGALLDALSGLLGPTTDGGLHLPGGLVLQASGQPAVLSVRNEPPFPIPGVAGGPDGSVAIELDLTLTEPTALPDFAGTVTLDVPLGGDWGAVSVALGLQQGIVSLALTPRTPAGPLEPIVLLPRFGGLGPLAADAAAALLPALLDALVARLPDPRPPLADAVLAVADALDIHGGAGAEPAVGLASSPSESFAAHLPQLRALAQPDGIGAMARTGLPEAVAQLWPLAGLPGSVAATASGIAVQIGVGDLDLAIDAGWGSTPTVRLQVNGLAAGSVAFDSVVVGFAEGAVTGGLTAAVALPAAAEQAIGLQLAPALQVEVSGSGLSVRALPLGSSTADLIEAVLLPDLNVRVGSGGVAAFIERLVLPLAAQVMIDHFDLDRPLFDGGPALAAVLRDAGVLATDGARLVVPLPALEPLLLRLLGALVGTGAVITLNEDLELRLVADASTTPPRLGLGLHGRTAVSGESFEVSLRIGESSPTWIPDAAPALRLLLIEQDTWQLKPTLRLAPLGLRLAGVEGAPLIDQIEVHLGAITAYLWAILDLEGGFDLDGIGGALDLDDLGLPLGAVSGADSSANPVAASLLSSSSGGSGPPADAQAVAPGIGLVAARRPDSPFALLRREDDVWVPFAERPLWFGVHQAFGPVAIDQIGVAHQPGAAGSGRPGVVQLLIDGGVKVGPLTVQAHELGVGAPLDRLDQPGTWRLDLAGLGVAVSTDSVSLAGGLVKRSGPPIDYLGTLTVEVAGRTLTAVGAYAQPVDQLGRFTSLFVFVGVPAVLGGPPCLFITGLGGGAGYNRRLVLPAEIADVPSFPLVTAIDDGINTDPMASLNRLGSAMPPERGSLWMAAGIRFTSFSFVRSVAVVYVTLGRDAEIGLLGVARASIPPPDAGLGSLELAFVELALKARFSPSDGVLSVQAQLTDNSWLLSRDCQLTGGFAFFVWFKRDQFVLTLGGYHPSFVKPPEFPVVPRLGFHWAVSDAVVIKGEAYFALTSSAVMAGGRLEVSYRKGGIYASFVAYADFLIAWDPFHYDIAVGVSVTAGFRIRVCFFACVTIDVSVSLGASVHLVGPPLRGEATLDLEICSVTVEFGHRPHDPPTFIGWEAFRDKYVIAGADDGEALSLHASRGLVPPDAVSETSPPGSRNNPWRLAGTFALRSETRLAATGFAVNGTRVAVPLTDGLQAVPAALDLAPMNVASVSGLHDLTLRSATSAAVLDADAMAQLAIEPVVGHVPAAVWRIADRPTASAAVLPVLAGLTISGQPRVADDGGRPAISVEIIDFNFEPLPIGLVDPPTLRGVLAPEVGDALRQFATSASGPRLARVGVRVLSEIGADARARAGLPTRPISALSARALRSRRSSPPLVVTLSAGVGTAAAVRAPRPTGATIFGGAGAPPTRTALSTPLTPRRRTAVRLPTSADPGVSVRTRVSDADGLPRSQPPGPPSRPLHRISTSAGAPPTRAAAAGRALRVPGDRLEPGDVHVWDLPEGTGDTWLVSGPGAVRIAFLDRAGRPVLDHELVADNGSEAALTAPAAAARAVVRALGRSPQPAVAGPGAVSLHAAPFGRPAVCGWQSGSQLVEIGPTALLARAATVHLPVPRASGPNGPTLVLAATALAGQPSCDTWLPGAVDVIAVIVDAAGAADGAELPMVTFDGDAPSQPPTIIVAGHRLYLLYAAGPSDRDLTVVRVEAGPAWRLAGVLGLPGTIDHWTPTLTAPGADHLVADGPLSGDGSVTIRHEPERLRS